MDWIRRLEFLAVVLVASVIFGVNFFRGLNMSGIVFKFFFIAGHITILNAVYSSLIFSLSTLFSTALLTREIYSRKPIPNVTDGPEVAAVIPAYKDAESLGDTVSSLVDSNYEDLEIYVVCEPDDEETINEAGKLPCKVVMNQNPGSKAEALNTAFNTIEVDYYALFDADELINPNFIPNAVGYLEEGYEAFQGRRVPIPEGWVEKLAYCERVLNHAFSKPMEILGFKYVKSSSTVITREVWEKVGGYEDMLTEDMDFTHKCYREEVKVKVDKRVTNTMEAPHSLEDFWGQRKRWSMGGVEIISKALHRGYWTNGSPRAIVSTVAAILGVFAPAFLIGLLSKITVLLLLGVELVYLGPVLIAAIPTLLLSYRDRDKTAFIGIASVLTFFAGVILAFVRLKGVFEYLLSHEGEWYTVEREGGLYEEQKEDAAAGI